MDVHFSDERVTRFHQIIPWVCDSKKIHKPLTSPNSQLTCKDMQSWRDLSHFYWAPRMGKASSPELMMRKTDVACTPGTGDCFQWLLIYLFCWWDDKETKKVLDKLSWSSDLCLAFPEYPKVACFYVKLRIWNQGLHIAIHLWVELNKIMSSLYKILLM